MEINESTVPEEELAKEYQKIEENAVIRALEILKENHIDVKEIPPEVYARVSGEVLMADALAFYADITVGGLYNDEEKGKAALLESAQVLLHSRMCFDQLAKLFGFTPEDVMTKDQLSRLDDMQKQAIEICKVNNKGFTITEALTYGMSIFVKEIKSFNNKDNPDLMDALRLAAAYIAKENVTRMFTNKRTNEENKENA